MKKILIFVLYVILANNLFGQGVLFYELKKPLNNQYEFSSIRIRNDSIFLMSEGCKQLFVCDLESKELIDEITLKNQKDNVDIEGFCLFKDLIFYTDESDNSIHIEALKSKKEINLSFQQQFEVSQNKNRNTGLEGIEINESGNYLYVLREKNSNGDKSYIYCFNMKHDKRSYHLSFEKRIEIELPYGQRYSDLTLSSDKRRLYLIRSTKGKYFIDTINLNEGSRFEHNYYKTSDLISINISSIVNDKEEEGFSSNIEGITAYGNSIFLVSDNKFGNGNCDMEGDKTMLIEIKL